MSVCVCVRIIRADDLFTWNGQKFAPDVVYKAWKHHGNSVVCADVHLVRHSELVADQPILL